MNPKNLIVLFLMSALCVQSTMAQSNFISCIASSPIAPEVIIAPDSIRPGDTVFILFETHNLGIPGFEFRFTSDCIWSPAEACRIEHSSLFVVRLTAPAESLSSSHEKLHFRVVCGSEYSEGQIPFSDTVDEQETHHHPSW